MAGLEALLAESAAAALAAAIDAALARAPVVDPATDAAAALRIFADTYVRFARARPALYELLSTSASPEQAGAERKALWNRLLAVVGALTGEADDTGAAVAVWAFLHGFVALEAAGLYGASGPRDGLARGVEALGLGL